MNEIIEQYRHIVIQLATPYSTGTGFLLLDAASPAGGVIVTSYHVVQGNREVVVEGTQVPRQLAKVVYSDPRHDLAFIAAPAVLSAPAAALADTLEVSTGDAVLALGHPFGLKFMAAQGKVSDTEHQHDGLTYLRHDAVLPPGNSGGPLVDRQGKIIGVNAYLLHGGDSMAFTLPVRYLAQSLSSWKQGKGQVGTSCAKCATAVFEATLLNGSCPHCGAPIELPSSAAVYETTGIARTIEDILGKCGHDVRLARRGPTNWEVRNGSANIFVSYYEPNGLIAGDAILCDLPSTDIHLVYEYLLRQNHALEALSFSVRGPEIVLSLVINDRYLSPETGIKLFRNLFDKADYYDNLLVEQFGATWKKEN